MVALLCGGLPLLEEAQLAVVVPEALSSPSLVQQQLPELLVQAGAPVGVRCTECAELEHKGPVGLVAFARLQPAGL